MLIERHGFSSWCQSGNVALAVSLFSFAQPLRCSCRLEPGQTDQAAPLADRLDAPGRRRVFVLLALVRSAAAGHSH